MLMKTLTVAVAMFAALVGTGLAADIDPQNTLYLDLADGRVIIKLRPDLAPKHVAQIKKLVSRSFYDGQIFHRVIADFMAQSGDPTGIGNGGSYEPNLPAEFTDTQFKRGSVGMARTGEDINSANSQFFICFSSRCDELRGHYTLWGEVVQGMEFVDKIAPGEPPEKPDHILKLQLAAGAK